MTMGMPGFGAGFGGSSGNRFSHTRGRMQGGVQGVNYPSPFFDVAHTYLPTTVKQMFRWCRYYFLTNPLINAVVFKMSEYPVTDILIDAENADLKKRWTEYFQDHLRYRGFQIEVGLDYHTYGNAFVSIGYPFKKYLSCTKCEFQAPADKIRANWQFTNYNFRMTCPKCGSIGDAAVQDYYFRNASGIKLIRWNPEDIEITYNDITGEYTYFYTIPSTVRNDIVIGKKDVLEGIPQVFIAALREQKGIVFSKDNLFHLRRPTLASHDRGWGIPLLLPVLKDVFYLQLMKKAQEAILLEHIVPLRILFPQAGSGTSDPYCVAPETLVETPGGLVRADEVVPGDYLRSHLGAWREVTAAKSRGVRSGESVFKFGVASLAAFPFKLSEEHPVLAVRRVGGRKKPRAGLVDPTFIQARDLRKGDYVAYPVKRTVRHGQEIDLAEHVPERAATDSWVYRRLSQGAAEAYEWLENNGDPKHAWGERKRLLDEKGWSEADYETAHAMRVEGRVDRQERFMAMSPGLARLIGYYLAEGSPKDSLVSFSLHLNETDISSTIESLVKGLGFRGVSHYEVPEHNGRSVVIDDVLLSGLLSSLCGHGFADKRVPDVVSEGSDLVVLEMLRGLFAGDGCDFKTGTNRVALKLSNPSIILEARRLLLSFGLIGGVMKEEPTETSIFRTAAYHLNYNGLAAEKLRALFHGDSFDFPDVPQKSGLFRGDYVLLRIDDIERVSDVPTVIGFQMDEDKSFCVAGVATHNTTINLVDWREHVSREIANWRMDNNYIPIMPLPLGNQTIGGDGRALMMTSEIQQWSEQIINGMQVPIEFIKGGLSYAGTNVSMRMLENSFIGYILRHKALARWVMQEVSSFLKWPSAAIRFKAFKMADDLQRKALDLQLNQAGKISDTTLLAGMDYDAEEENKIMKKETSARMEATKAQQLATAEIQGESQLIMNKYQVKAQQAMAEAQMAPAAPGEAGGPNESGGGTPGGQTADDPAQQAPAAPQEAPPPPTQADPMSSMQSPLNAQQRLQPGQGAVDLPSMAMMQAKSIEAMSPPEQAAALQNLRAQSPELADLVEQILRADGITPAAAQPAQGAGGVDMTPMPDKLPPRRANAGI